MPVLQALAVLEELQCRLPQSTSPHMHSFSFTRYLLASRGTANRADFGSLIFYNTHLTDVLQNHCWSCDNTQPACGVCCTDEVCIIAGAVRRNLSPRSSHLAIPGPQPLQPPNLKVLCWNPSERPTFGGLWAASNSRAEGMGRKPLPSPATIESLDCQRNR